VLFLLSKLHPLDLLPLGFSWILLLVGLIGFCRWPVITAVVLLWVCFLGLVIVRQTLWRWLEMPWQRTTAAAATSTFARSIVVLSGGRHLDPGAARVSEWPDPDSFLLALICRFSEALWRAHQGSPLIPRNSGLEAP
jgi:hypothetical protein